MLLLSAQTSQSHAQASASELKAIFLFNFLDFMQWPDDRFEAQGNKANICIIGDDKLAKDLRYIAEKKKARGVYGLQVASAATLAEWSSLDQCNLLYLDNQREQDASELLKKVQGKSILTVSDIRGFANNGGAIEFTKKRKKLGLRINRTIVRLARLTINPHLLALADVIDSDEREMPFEFYDEERLVV